MTDTDISPEAVEHRNRQITTDKDCIQNMLRALPFADNDAGLAETGELIRMLHVERDALQARVAELKAASAWQDIETAPKDGTKICGYRWDEYLDCPDIETTKTVWWDSRLAKWHSYTGDTLWHGFQPTRWQPLPTPPDAKGGA